MLVCFVVEIYLQVFVCVCMYVVPYTVLSYVHVPLFHFLCVNQHGVLFDMLSLITVSPNYYLFPFPHPSPPGAIMIATISMQ